MFVKGQSGNLSGRPKGVGNKTTEKIRSWISSFLENNLESFEADINSLEPKDRVKAVSDLMEYALPKLARVENVNENNGEIQIRIVRDGNINQSETTSSSAVTDTTGSEEV